MFSLLASWYLLCLMSLNIIFIYAEALLNLIFSLTGDMGVGKSCLLHQFTEKKCKHNLDVLDCIVNGNTISTSRVCKFY